jgi:hypothetical protein
MVPAAIRRSAARSSPSSSPPATPPRVVPERYELTVPPNSLLDQSDLDAIAATAKAQKLTQEEAQQAVANYQADLTAQTDAFRRELEADPTIGGAHLATTQRDVARALDAFAPATTPDGQAARAFLNKTGLGNQVHLVRVLARIGKALGEDTPIAQAVSRGAQPKTIEELFYGPQA